MPELSSLKIDRSGKSNRKSRRRSGSRWIFPLFLLVVLAGTAAVFYRPIMGFVDRMRLPNVQVVRVERTHPASVGAVEGTAANGHVVAARRAALSADTPGRIVEMMVTEGSVVRKGEVVARLFADEYKAALGRAEADVQAAEAEVIRAEALILSTEAAIERRRRNAEVAAAQSREATAQKDLAEVRLARTQKMVKEGVLSIDAQDAALAEQLSAVARVASAKAAEQAAQADIADSTHQRAVAQAALTVARARVAVAQATARQAAATLDKTFVRAPFNGIVVLKDAEVGEVVSPNSQGGATSRGAVCTMVDFDSLEVQAEVPETSLTSVRLGAEAAIYLDAYPARTYPGKVSRIWPTANRQKASVEVRVTFDKLDKDLRPDMGVRVVFLPEGGKELDTSTKEPEILVPEDAVVEQNGKPGAFVVERGVVQFQPIEIGGRRGGQVTVASGLRPGQRIVLKPPPELTDGSRVQVPDQ